MTKRNKMGLVLFFAIIGLALAAHAQTGSGIAFTRVFEPNEAAFSILMPRGWRHQGGIFRVDAAQAGGPLNAMEAKCDWLLMSDARGSVAFWILPDIVCAHAGIGGGFFPPGSNYQGAEVRARVDAPTHLKSLIQGLHPDAVGLRMIEIHRLPGETESLNHGLAYTNRLLAQIGLGGQTFRCDAAGAVYEYTEGGLAYREVMLTGIVDMRAAMTWKNTRTLAFRAPAGEFDRFRPIMNDNFLVLTGQEEYVNLHTGKVEVDTDAYRYRWKSAGGDVYYTNQEDENPNTFLHGGGYERIRVRKRRNV